jgi:hypothetical protein
MPPRLAEGKNEWTNHAIAWYKHAIWADWLNFFHRVLDQRYSGSFLTEVKKNYMAGRSNAVQA